MLRGREHAGKRGQQGNRHEAITCEHLQALGRKRAAGTGGHVQGQLSGVVVERSSVGSNLEVKERLNDVGGLRVVLCRKRNGKHVMGGVGGRGGR